MAIILLKKVILSYLYRVIMVLVASVMMTTHMSVKTACTPGIRYIATVLSTKGAHSGRGTITHTNTLKSKFHLNLCFPIFIGRCSRAERGSDFFSGCSGFSVVSFPLKPWLTNPRPEKNIVSLVMCGDAEVLRSVGILMPLTSLSGFSSSSEILHKYSVSGCMLHASHFTSGSEWAPDSCIVSSVTSENRNHISCHYGAYYYRNGRIWKVAPRLTFQESSLPCSMRAYFLVVLHISFKFHWNCEYIFWHCFWNISKSPNLKCKRNVSEEYFFNVSEMNSCP